MTDKAEILALQEQWVGFEKSGDNIRVLDLCSQDVVWLIPSVGSLRGKTAVGKWLESQELPDIEQIELSQVEIEVSGNLAVKRADFVTSIRSPETSKKLEFRGSHLWTLRKDKIKGCWQVSIVTWVIAK